MSKKDTNPKDALGIRKAPVSTLPMQVVFETGLAMLEGARKYGRHNYRSVGVRGSVYFDACIRHLSQWWEGQDIDPDSGLSHVTKAIACLFVLRDSMIAENWVDDRPPQHSKKLDLEKINNHVAEIIDKYPDCVEPYTELNKVEDCSKKEFAEKMHKVAGGDTPIRFCADCWHQPLCGICNRQPATACKQYNFDRRTGGKEDRRVSHYPGRRRSNLPYMGVCRRSVTTTRRGNIKDRRSQ